jgi:hypothetical protein
MSKLLAPGSLQQAKREAGEKRTGAKPEALGAAAR